MYKKLLKFIVVQREGLEYKWWHRLANVLIYGTTIFVFLISAIINFLDSEWEWKSYTYNSFSFEDNYTQTRGKEVDCEFNNTRDTTASNNPPTITCDGDYIKISEFLSKYNDAVRKKFGNKNESCDSKERDEFGKLTENAIQCFREEINIVAIEPADWLDGLKFNRDIKAKKQTHIDYVVLLKEAFFVLLITISWFIFWEAIVYRSIIYIVMGSKKNL